jgi:hypothetical protein
MSGQREFTEEMHRYLDGEPISLDSDVRSEAEQIVTGVRDYAVSLQVPGPEVDAAVMAVVRERRASGRRRTFWRWFVEPQAVRLRPALAAALVAAVVGVTLVVARDDAGSPPHMAGTELVDPRTVLVRFELRAPNAEQVAVAGSFSDWDESGIPLTLNPATGLWVVTLPLTPGAHQYLFVIDGNRWAPDPAAHAQVDDGFGQVNSVIVVGPRGVVRS